MENQDNPQPEVKEVSPEKNPEPEKSREEKILEQKKIIRPLRTFEDDIANFVKKGKVSKATIIMAEENRRREKKVSEKNEEAKNDLFLGMKLSVVMIILGAIIIIVSFIIVKPIDRIGNLISGPSSVDDTLFDKKASVEIDVSSKLSSEVKLDVAYEILNAPQLNRGEIYEIKIVSDKFIESDSGRGNNVSQKVSAIEFMNALELNAPDRLKRSLSDDYLFGLIGVTAERKTPFLLLGVSDFDRTFSGMLEWEPNMWRHVNDYFNEKLTKNDLEAGTENVYLSNPVDVIIFNRDSRAIVNGRNEVEFFYTFVNDDYLLLAEDPNIVENIANKLNLQSLVR